MNSCDPRPAVGPALFPTAGVSTRGDCRKGGQQFVKHCVRSLVAVSTTGDKTPWTICQLGLWRSPRSLLGSCQRSRSSRPGGWPGCCITCFGRGQNRRLGWEVSRDTKSWPGLLLHQGETPGGLLTRWVLDSRDQCQQAVSRCGSSGMEGSALRDGPRATAPAASPREASRGPDAQAGLRRQLAQNPAPPVCYGPACTSIPSRVTRSNSRRNVCEHRCQPGASR
jgi:hypothetical protein